MTETKQKKIREKIGQVFIIPLSDGIFGYCQMVSKTKYAFFNFFDHGEHIDIEEIISSDVLFFLTIDSFVIKEGLWEMIGILNVRKEFVREDQFSYDSLAGNYIIWRVIDGRLQQIKANSDEIKDLECFASSNDRHVIERLEDYLAGRPNYWVQLDKNQHDPNFPGITEFYKKYGYDYKLNKN